MAPPKHFVPSGRLAMVDQDWHKFGRPRSEAGELGVQPFLKQVLRLRAEATSAESMRRGECERGAEQGRARQAVMLLTRVMSLVPMNLKGRPHAHPRADARLGGNSGEVERRARTRVGAARVGARAARGVPTARRRAGGSRCGRLVGVRGWLLGVRRARGRLAGMRAAREHCSRIAHERMGVRIAHGLADGLRA